MRRPDYNSLERGILLSPASIERVRQEMVKLQGGRLERVNNALELMKRARQQLRIAGADQAAGYVARALKSVEGAKRHAERRVHEADIKIERTRP